MPLIIANILLIGTAAALAYVTTIEAGLLLLLLLKVLSVVVAGIIFLYVLTKITIADLHYVVGGFLHVRF